jgi:hypothetical protein
VTVEKSSLAIQRIAPKAKQKIVQELGRRLTLSADERAVFFHGFLLGLKFEESVSNTLATIKWDALPEKTWLRLYLWLRWPEVEAMKSIPAVYARCVAAFGSLNRAHVVGSPEAFRRFCNRCGLSYEQKQREQHTSTSPKSGRKRRTAI